MQTNHKKAEYLEGTISRGVETVPSDRPELVDVTVTDRENDGWLFADSREIMGFTHLYFVRYESH